MTTIEDLERRLEALEIDMPMHRGIVAHLHDLDTKFQRLDEGQQRIELAQRQLEHKVDGLDRKIDDGLHRIDAKFGAVFAHFKINFE